MFNPERGNRPIINIRWTAFDKAVEGITLCILTLLWVFVVISYHSFPERIITHYNFEGEADAFGSKTGIWHLPVVVTLLYILLTLVNRYPQVFNYLEEITINNAESQYRSATRMIRILKLVVVIVFTIITYSSVSYL